MFYEKLSDNEVAMIEGMREMARPDYATITGRWATTKEFLNYWDQAKCQYMQRVFKDELILRRKVEVTIEDNELHDRMDQLCWSYDFSLCKDKIIKMLGENQDIYAIVSNFSSILSSLRHYMFTVDAFIANKYQGDTMELKLPDGSIFKLSKGAKLMKAIGRLAKAANATEEFEHLRLQQSQIMNQAHITTDLCISIHPMDYMTASYNANDWRSCMCWEDGEYRRGVIEMMNSPYVIVAYTQSSHEKISICWNREEGKYRNWNSKKWREFFIVDPKTGIYGIKGYPYWNRNLEDITLKWLAELFAEEANNSLASEITNWRTDERFSTPFNKNTEVVMRCGPAMYNDFYGGNEYHAIFSKDMQDRYLDIDYSGVSECIACGCAMYGDDFDSEGDLVCNNCMPHNYCAACGERIYNDDYAIEYNGLWYCEHCFDNLPRCDVCDDPVDMDNEDGINFVLAKEDEDDSEILMDGIYPLERCVCGDCAKDVFTLGIEEIRRNHHCWSHNWRYYDEVPINRLTAQGLELLYNENEIKTFIGKDINKD